MHIVAKTEKHVVQKWVAIICERPKHIEEKKYGYQSLSFWYMHLEWSPAIVTFLSYYYIIILLDFLIISKCVPNRSKSISNDIIRFSPFCSNENMRFSYILIISLECNKSRWSLQLWYLHTANDIPCIDQIGRYLYMPWLSL